MDNKLTRAEFLHWKEDPVTKLVMRCLEDKKAEIVTDLLESSLVDMRDVGKLQGKASIIDEIINLNYTGLLEISLEE